jgi:hypothetical protein
MENDLIPVEGCHKHLYRDQNTGAIINDDIVGFTYNIMSSKRTKTKRA